MYYPQGCSKWNPIEHRYFSYISRNWRGKPLINVEIVKKFVDNTTTNQGLISYSVIDETVYEKGKTISQNDKNNLNIVYIDEKVKWNYIVFPNNKNITDIN